MRLRCLWLVPTLAAVLCPLEEKAMELLYKRKPQ